MNIFLILENLLFGTVVIRTMGIFFEKRRTSRTIVAFSYFFCVVITSIIYMYPESSSFAFMYYFLVSIIALFIISLNYESSMIRRLTAISCMNVFFVLFNAVMYYLANVFSFYILESPSIGMYFLFNLFRFLLYHLVISLLAIQFKNIKKMSIDVPVLWVTALVIVVMANAVTIVISQSGNEFRLFEILVVLMLAIICFVFFICTTQFLLHTRIN